MSARVKLRIAPIWDRTREEIAARALARSQAVRLAAERRTEAEWRERVERNRIARVVRRVREFVNQPRERASR